MNFTIGIEHKPDKLLPPEKRVHLILDRQEEVDQLYALLNFVPIATALEIADNDWIKLRTLLPVTGDERKWHSKLCKVNRHNQQI